MRMSTRKPLTWNACVGGFELNLGNQVSHFVRFSWLLILRDVMETHGVVISDGITIFGGAR